MRKDLKRAFNKWENARLIHFHLVPVEHLCSVDNVPLLGVHYWRYDIEPQAISVFIKGLRKCYEKFWMFIEGTSV